MKKYRDLLKELPSKTAVFAVGRFNPPNIGHELLVKVVRKLAGQRKADHIIFVSKIQDAKKNPLDTSKKLQYLELLFPKTKFMQKETAEALSFLKKYKHVIMVAPSELVDDYKKLLKKHLDSFDVVPAGSKCPDSDDKMIKLAVKGDYNGFRSLLPTSSRELDAKRLMNDLRYGVGLEPIKEQLNLVKDELREQYFRGEIFNEGDIVESNDTVYRIVKRGSNHLLLQNEQGLKVSKWIQEVQLTERQFMLDDKQLQEADAAVAHGGAAGNAIKKAQSDSEKAMLSAKQAEERAKMIEKQKKEMDNLKTSLQKESKCAIPKSIMSLNDFRKTMSMGVKGVDQVAMDDKETESDLDAVQHATGKASAQSHVGGHHMDGGKSESIRRMRIKYHLGEETEEQQDTHKVQLKRFKDQAADAKLTEAQYAGLEKEDKPGKKSTEFKGTKNAVAGKTVEGWKDEKKPVAEGIKSAFHNYMAKRAGAKADHAYDMGDEKEFQKHVDNAEKHRVAAGGKPTKINTDPDKKFLTYREEVELQEGKMSEIATDIENHLGKHIDEYKKNGGAEHFGSRVLKTQDHIAKLHGLEQKHAASLVNSYVDSKLHEEFEDINEAELETLVAADMDALPEEAFYEAYDDEELAIIDDETGEEIEAVSEEAELDSPALMEVLSRHERIMAKSRMRRTKAKRTRAEKVALRKFSTPQVANKRARRMAISAMKKRLLNGRNPQKVSVGEKERVERFIAQRKKIVDRLSARMVSRVKQVEKARMSHKKFTKPNNGVAF